MLCGKARHYALVCSQRKREVQSVFVEAENGPEGRNSSNQARNISQMGSNRVELVGIQPTNTVEAGNSYFEVPITVNGTRILAVLDTGANISVIDESVVEKYGWMEQSNKLLQ
jgi:predicted aspartyl protease